MWVIRAGIQKKLVRIANREDPNLGLHCLSWPFRQVTKLDFLCFFTLIFGDSFFIFDNSKLLSQ